MPGPQTRIEGEPCDGFMGESPLNEGLQRRQVLALGSAAMAACCLGACGSALAANPAPAAERPQKGDWLVIADEGEHEGKVVMMDMLSVGGAMMNAWPVDAETKTTRSKSRFNKVVVVRVEPGKLDEATLAKSVEGIIAFSSVCTHQACAVTGWIPEDAMLACPCHGSLFSVGEGGKVLGGPARKRLPILPLAVDADGMLTVADAFTAKVGPAAQT
ncbi:MAG TPA: Rieske (2Fe-2S) protein [Skermanella sp.]|nr:Rieske (2Fe-2S) protein [Skermanella sp.]